MEKIAGLIPGAEGYRERESRRDTDERVRAHVASEIERLREKIESLKRAAGDEGEEDMLEDLDRIDARMTRTIDALRSTEYSEVEFFDRTEVPEEELARICAYDQALLEDLDLLVTDVMGMKYETIGNLTLREAEGTLAAIELKITNRKDLFEASGRR